ncbi:MAG: glycosyltransferase family 2 protein, partial [Planctomycetes bacterium]|nr:glycosyltransferase family 2 protein [Planctomycetota bacterium]
MIQNQLFVSENVLDSVVVETPVVKKTIPVSPQAIESRKAKVIVGIPAYNEERFIAQIVLGVSKYADEVVVVDDGSTDRTAEVAKAAGASVIQHKINKGAGAATESCFKEARRRNADVLITMDGDGQHNPEEIVRVAVPALTGTADVVIGSRFLT